MTPVDVALRLGEIRKLAHDPEAAHVLEDKLWHDVLAEIAFGCECAQALAAERDPQSPH